MPEVVVSLLGSAGNAGKPLVKVSRGAMAALVSQRRNAGQAMDLMFG